MKWPSYRFFDVKNHTIIAGYMGSHSHGTYVPPKKGGIDDIDIMGICVPPKKFYIGLQKFEQIQTMEDQYDYVFYEIKKYFNLLLKCNPNVIGLLWLKENEYVKIDPVAEILIEKRDIFSSKKSYNAFTGYAYSQLNAMSKFNKQGFMGEKRKKLVEQFGYDTKNAAHLIRLLRMGIEFLSTGKLNVFREDAKQLIAIKNGEYSFEKIKEMAESLFKDGTDALISSMLPSEPDYDKAEKILMTILEKRLFS